MNSIHVSGNKVSKSFIFCTRKEDSNYNVQCQ